jgi:hypothetical protein
MGQAISTVLATTVGLLTWGLSYLLSGGIDRLGSFGFADALVFFAPIMGAVLPAAIRFFDSGQKAGAAWMLAVAPLAGALNFLLLITCFPIAHAIFGRSNASATAAYVVATVVWLLPLYLSARRSKIERREQEGQPEPVKMLRRPGRW